MQISDTNVKTKKDFVNLKHLLCEKNQLQLHSVLNNYGLSWPLSGTRTQNPGCEWIPRRDTAEVEHLLWTGTLFWNIFHTTLDTSTTNIFW